MVSHVARSRSAARSWSPSSWRPSLSNTRSSGTVRQRMCRCVQSPIELPQKLQSSGVHEATSNQWWQTRRKLYEPIGSPPKSPSGMTLQQKMLPSISGDRRMEMFNRELRARLSCIIAFSWPSRSSICFPTPVWNQGFSLGPSLFIKYR